MYQPPSKKRYVTLTLTEWNALALAFKATQSFMPEYLIDMRASSVAIAPEPVWMLQACIDQRKDPEVEAQLATAQMRMRYLATLYVTLPPGHNCRVVPVFDSQVLPRMHEGMASISVPNNPSFTFDKVHIIASRSLCGTLVSWVKEKCPESTIEVKEGTDFDQDLSYLLIPALADDMLRVEVM